MDTNGGESIFEVSWSVVLHSIEDCPRHILAFCGWPNRSLQVVRKSNFGEAGVWPLLHLQKPEADIRNETGIGPCIIWCSVLCIWGITDLKLWRALGPGPGRPGPRKQKDCQSGLEMSDHSPTGLIIEYYQLKQGTIKGKSLKNYHTFTLFDSLKMGPI